MPVDDAVGVVAAFASQADACARLGSPMYADLIARLGDDVEAGGPARSVLDATMIGTDDPAGDAWPLRLVGRLHRLVLAGEAPDLEDYYPSVGGTWDGERAWPVLQDALTEHRADLAIGMLVPPQTNEVGRASALMGGLLRVADRFSLPLHVVEIGTSAALLLRSDQFRYTSPSGAYGPERSPVLLEDAWRGPLPPLDAPLEIVERVGYDVAPLDPTDPDDQLTLMAYTWPDQADRLERLRGACVVAADVPARIERVDAADALDELELVEGAATVVWHSVMWQYLPPDTRDRISKRLAHLGADADPDHVLAHVRMEPDPDGTPRAAFDVTLTTWPFGEDTVIGRSAPHGIPTTWTGA